MSENTNPEQTPAQPLNPGEVPDGYDKPTQYGQPAPSWQQPPASATEAPSYREPDAPQGYQPPNPQQGYPQSYQQQGSTQGYQQPGYPQNPQQQGYGMVAGGEPKSKVVAGILGILLGGLGIHNFYLGKNKIALIQLLVSVVSFGFLAPFMAIWGLIEGILYLIGHENYRTDSRGIPLKD